MTTPDSEIKDRSKTCGPRQHNGVTWFFFSHFTSSKCPQVTRHIAFCISTSCVTHRPTHHDKLWWSPIAEWPDRVAGGETSGIEFRDKYYIGA